MVLGDERYRLSPMQCFSERKAATMGAGDAEQTRMVHRELNRRYVDSSRLEVRVIHGIVYMRGMMTRLRTHPEVDLEHESDIIRKIIRQKQGIREIIWEVSTPN
ncbi:MAG: hypothetical protein FJX72_14220 [Armatimonadetes bacterium]|nr:hypothetical protein [Armatimonadota bacterium]